MPKPKAPKKTTGAGSLAASTATANPTSAPSTTAGVIAASDGTPEVRKATRKPEIVRSEARPNLVPINVEDEIRRLAYLYSERRGFSPGHETEDWLAAEHEVRQRYHQMSAQHSA
ncbi:MAG TPA: DUF2934 domain-containing protein [Candidatus Solibacter sp.]|nr:DUF2934 domain-containing protein [Candidatus Solibacter sp.]